MRVLYRFLVGSLVVISASVWWGDSGSAAPMRRERVLRGARAKAYVKELRKEDRRFRRLMEKAEDDLRSRGFVEEPDGVIVVEFEQDAPQFGVLDWLLPAVHAQTVNVSGGNRGRVVWSAWNDGDNRTWEGNITGQSYTYSAYSSANMQFDVRSRTWAPHTLWWDDVGLSQPEGNAPTRWHGGRCNGDDITKHAMEHAMQGAASTCATAGAMCAAFGPGYFNCLASACIGALAKGFIDEMSAWAHECNRRCIWTSVSAGVYECV